MDYNELIAYLDKRFEENARKIDERFAENARQMNGLKDEVRHTHIQVEGLRGDVQLIAEKVGTLDEKIESVRSELKAEIGDVKDLFVRSHRNHETRIRDLEDRVKKRASGKSRPQVE